MTNVPKNSAVMSWEKLMPTYRAYPGIPGPTAMWLSNPTANAPSPRMVTALNGSATLRAASQPFPFGVSGTSCGPFRNRCHVFSGRVVHGTAAE